MKDQKKQPKISLCKNEYLECTFWSPLVMQYNLLVTPWPQPFKDQTSEPMPIDLFM